MPTIDENFAQVFIAFGKLSAQVDACFKQGAEIKDLVQRLKPTGDAPPGPGPVPPPIQPGPRPYPEKALPSWEAPMPTFDASEALDRAMLGWAPDGRQINSGQKLLDAQAEWKRLAGMPFEQWLSDVRGSAYAAARLSGDAVCFLVHLDLISFTDPWAFFGGRGQRDAASWAGLGLEQCVIKYNAELSPGDPSGGQ